MAELTRLPIRSGVGLCLHPPGCCPPGATCCPAEPNSPLMLHTTVMNPAAPTTSSHHHQQQQQHQLPLTIFYGTRVGTVDVTEAQARLILHAARVEAERVQIRRVQRSGGHSDQTTTSGSEAAPASQGGDAGDLDTDHAVAYPRGAIVGQSMKRSLRRFLEKRATRLRNASHFPYSIAAAVTKSSI